MGAILTVVFVGLLFEFVDFTLIRDAIADVNPLSVLFASFLMALTQVVRALRLAILLDMRGMRRFALLFRIMVYYNLANLYLPMRLGELVFIWLIKKNLGQALSESVGIFLVVRILDAMALLIVAALAAWFVIPSASALSWLPYVLTVTAIGAVVFLVGGPPLSRRIEHLLDAVGNTLVSRTVARILAVFSAVDQRKLTKLVAVTASSWVCIAVASLVVIDIALGRDSMALAAWASAGSGVSFMFPVSGLAGIGPFEAATVATLAIAGIATHDAVGTALLLHAVVLIAPLVLLPFAGLSVALVRFRAGPEGRESG